MIISPSSDCESNVLEAFLQEILQQEYYMDEQTPGLIDTMKYIKSMNQEVLHSHIFSMLFQYKIKNAVDAYIRLNDKLDLMEFIDVLLETLNDAKKENFVDHYSITYNNDTNNQESIIVFYYKDDLEYSINIQP